MKTSCIKLLATFLLLSLCSCHTLQTSAQTHIDKVVAQLEKNHKIEKSVVNKRDPNTGDLLCRIESYSFKDKKLTKELIDAFDQDECKASKSAINRNDNNVSYAFVFNKKKMTISYFLSCNDNYTNLSIIQKSADYDSNGWYPQYYDFGCYNPDLRDMIEWNDSENAQILKDKLSQLGEKLEKASKEYERQYKEHGRDYEEYARQYKEYARQLKEYAQKYKDYYNYDF